MSTISSFRSIENRHDVCRGKDCMKTFCKKSTLWRSLILEWSYKQSKWSYKQTNSSKHAISVIFIIWSNYDYHFIIKELAEEFEGQVTCLGEHTEKYITFSVLIEKEVIRII